MKSNHLLSFLLIANCLTVQTMQKIKHTNTSGIPNEAFHAAGKFLFNQAQQQAQEEFEQKYPERAQLERYGQLKIKLTDDINKRKAHEDKASQQINQARALSLKKAAEVNSRLLD